MMISTKGRYALRVMLDLAQHAEDGYLSLKAISERQGISMKYLEQIVAILQKGGLLLSRRGKEGGYCLSRKPAQYPISEIVNLTEGTLAPVACLEDGKAACTRSGHCMSLPLWVQLDAVIEGYLSSVTLQDLLDGNLPPVDASGR